MKHPRDYRGQEVVVLGLAKSGQAVAELFHSLGADVTINDKKPKQECEQAEELEKKGIRVICGIHPDDLIHKNVALLVKNPGIPYHVKPVQDALEQGIEVVTEVEAAYHICAAEMIGITGSNGKTTTTSWVGEILKSTGLHTVIAGNIGLPLTTAVMNEPNADWFVVELSSFQLKGTTCFRPRISCLLNIYETHLDYHGSLEDYIASKAKIMANQGSEDTAVVNWDDPVCRNLSKHTKAAVFPFSMKEKLPFGVYLSSDQDEQNNKQAQAKEQTQVLEWIVYRDEHGMETRIVEKQELQVLGRHNLQNAIAVSAICLAAGISINTLCKGIQTFKGVEHRLEYVGEQGGVLIYNDSKATNPSATKATLEAFQAPVVLIAGGLERGMSYDDLVVHLRTHVKAIVTLGETRGKLAAAANKAGISKIQVIEDTNKQTAMNEAVQAAHGFSAPGDVILLSPACASWDMYTTYEERGSMFKKSVHKLV